MQPLWAVLLIGVVLISKEVTKMFTRFLKIYLQSNWFLIRLWPTVCNLPKKQTPSQIFTKTLLKLSKLLFGRANLWWWLLLLDQNSRYYEQCIKQTAPRQLTISISNRDFHETSKRSALMGQTLLVRRTLCSICIKHHKKAWNRNFVCTSAKYVYPFWARFW